MPRLVASQDATGEPIRVWCAGCASGEEAYTLAMVLAEALGVQAFRERVKIYAHRRRRGGAGQGPPGHLRRPGRCPPSPPTLLEKYFEPVDDHYCFHKELRRSVIFGRHDLIQDAPISRVDLLVCRNTLMYFNAETQARILDRFHFALNDGGFLFLGQAETLLTYSDTLHADRPEAAALRQGAAPRPPRPRRWSLPRGVDERSTTPATTSGSATPPSSPARSAQIVVDPAGTLDPRQRAARGRCSA